VLQTTQVVASLVLQELGDSKQMEETVAPRLRAAAEPTLEVAAR
jgi:hypothetical protein